MSLLSLTTPPTVAEHHAAMPAFRVRHFSVPEYQRFIELGMITEADDAELLEGIIVHKMSRNAPHDGHLDHVEEVLRSYLPGNWRVRSQKAITTDDSQPEPDLAVVPGPATSYFKQHPRASQVVLVGEVADSSLEDDRLRKGRIYARAGIACYWIVNLIERQIEVYTDPTGPVDEPQYQQRQDYKGTASVPLRIADLEVARIPVQELLP